MDEESVTKKCKIFMQTKLNFPVALCGPTEEKTQKNNSTSFTSVKQVTKLDSKSKTQSN